MEEEKKTAATEEKAVSENKADKGAEKKEIKLSLSDRMLNSAFAIVALLVLALTHVLWRFGVGGSAFGGIMAIIVLGLAVAGLLWNYLRFKKPTLEFFFSAGVAFLAFLAL